MKPEEIVKQAEAELAKYPPVAYRPEWHPYFWMGQLEAARRLSEPKDGEGHP